MILQNVFTILWTFIAAFALLSITVFVHELGHYLAARRKGLLIERFAIGFGPKAIGWKHDGVEYVINWLPFGGFVQLPQMAAMEMVEGKSQLDAAQLPPISPWAKIVTAFWGPLFSFLLAIVLACLAWWVGTPQNQNLLTTTIGYVEKDSPAAKAGILPGDKIVAIDGQSMARWAGKSGGVVEAIILSLGRTVDVKIEREGVGIMDFSIVPAKDPEMENLRRLGFEKHQALPLIVDSILEHSPAQKAGLIKGDRILKANGKVMYSPALFKEIVVGASEPIQLEYERAGEMRSASIMPEKAQNAEGLLIGVVWDVENIKIVHMDPWTQVQNSLTFIFRTLRAVTTPQSDVGVRHLSGPVGIFDKLMSLLTTDPRLVLYFTVILNVNLAVINLMPIPILDGGHILLSVLEAIRRRPMEAQVMQWVQMTFFGLMITLFVFITFHDVWRIGKRMNQPEPAAMQMPKFEADSAKP